MTAPKLTTTGTIHVLTWGDLEVRVERVRENSQYEVKGEVTVNDRSLGNSYLLGRERVNLSSGMARKGLAKRLEGKAGGVDWFDKIEQMSGMVIDRHREGEPEVDLSEGPEPKEMEYLIHPILPKGKPTIVHGKGGVAKGYIACYCAVLASTGTSVGMLKTDPNYLSNVLYLDWEDDEDEAKRRLREVSAGLGLEHRPPVVYQHCSRPFSGMGDAIQGKILKHNIDFVVVDSLIPACGGDANSSEKAEEFYRALNALGTKEQTPTFLLVGHQSKQNLTGQTTTFGSGVWEFLARRVWEVKLGSQEKDQIEISINDKKRNRGGFVDPFGYRILFEPGVVTFEDIDVADVPEFERGLKRPTRIKALLERTPGNAMTAHDIAEALEDAQGIIATTLSKTKAFCYITRDGSYGLEALRKQGRYD